MQKYKFQFKASLVTWKNIFNQVTITNEIAQKVDSAINSGTKQLQVTKNNFINIGVIIGAADITKDLESKAEFKPKEGDIDGSFNVKIKRKHHKILKIYSNYNSIAISEAWV